MYSIKLFNTVILREYFEYEPQTAFGPSQTEGQPKVEHIHFWGKEEFAFEAAVIFTNLENTVKLTLEFTL